MPQLTAPALPFTPGAVVSDLIATGALALGVFLAAQLAAQVVSRNQSIETQRIWRLTFRHLAAIVFVFGLGAIWKTELQAVLLALGATAAGFMIAFREVWMSLLSFWMRVLKRDFTVGDFIEVDGIRGKVLDLTWQYTVLAETGPGPDGLTYSGRVVQIPNNRLLATPFFMENLTGEFAVHMLTVMVPADGDALRAESVLVASAREQCAAFADAAARHMLDVRRDKALDTPSVEPKASIRFEDKGEMRICLRIVVPFKERLRIEQAIIRDYLRGMRY